MDRKEMLYPDSQRRLDRAKGRLMMAKTANVNKTYLLDYLKKIQADGTGKAQMISYLDRLIPILELVGHRDLRKVTKKEMEDIFSEYRGRRLSISSLNKTIECIKALYRWMFDRDLQDRAPDAVRWLRRETVRNKLRAEDLWTEEDMEKVMKAARSLRDKAILSVLYEAGMRPGELRGLRIRDVVVNGNMMRLYVAGKTEKKTGERVVPVLRSYQVLRMWLSQHPRSNEPDAWLWTPGGEPLRDVTLRFMVGEVAERAKIQKPKNPYILRHTALTRFYKRLPGIVASKLAGHSPNSREAQTYTHLATKDVEDAVLEMNGMPRRREGDSDSCGKCGKVLNIGDRICPGCGLLQGSEDALREMEYTESARNFMYGLEHLSKENPDLRELKDRMQDMVSRMLDKGR